MKLIIVTPEKPVYDSEITFVSLPTPDGEITILPHHIPLITKVIAGEMKIGRIDSKEDYFATGGGFAEITGNHVSVLTDLAEHAHDINEKAVEQARKRAEDALAKADQLTDEEVAIAQATLLKSLTQLSVVRRRRRT